MFRIFAVRIQATATCIRLKLVFCRSVQDRNSFVDKRIQGAWTLYVLLLRDIQTLMKGGIFLHGPGMMQRLKGRCD